MAFLPAVLLTVGIAVVSLWESPHLPREIAVRDKLVHGLMYTVLAIAWMVPLVCKKTPRLKCVWTRYVPVCLGVTAYGSLLEVMQRFCTLTRSGEMADVYADFAGAFLGVAVVGVICYLRHPDHL